MAEKKAFNEKVYKKEYAKKNYKRIPLDVTLAFFDTIVSHTQKTGEARNVFIKRAIQETIENDNKNNSKN